MSDRPMVNVYEDVDGVETLVYREMNDAEYAQHQTDQDDAAQQALDRGRAEQTAAFKSALAETDKWAARAVEDGEPMAPERVKYRQQLRALLGTIAKSDDPASVEIPDPPENPKAST